MAELVRKICMLGDFGVGKTSLVARFVNNVFSEKYVTTIGVKIDTKHVDVAGQAVKLVLWDIAGKNALDGVKLSYLQGAAGIVLVADGTREPTLRSALFLLMQAKQERPDLKAVLLVNKFDLFERWEVSPTALADIRKSLPVYESSAQSGEGVEEAFLTLSRELLA
jgi:small GTP-binding protein